jgi:hypothetical protein
MKMIRIILFVIIIVNFLGACSVLKRRYCTGWFVKFNQSAFHKGERKNADVAASVSHSIKPGTTVKNERVCKTASQKQRTFTGLPSDDKEIPKLDFYSSARTKLPTLIARTAIFRPITVDPGKRVERRYPGDPMRTSWIFYLAYLGCVFLSLGITLFFLLVL